LKNLTILALTSAALALSACADNDADETAVTDTPEMATETGMMADDAMPVGGELSENQQTAYDAMDRQAVSDEYDANRDAEMASASESDSSPSMDASQSSDDANVNPIPPRSEMDFAYLDRNSDGKLSVAEYAIWAVPANPNTPVSNDQTKPYITTAQINEAGQTFFYFDEDGDSYLSDGEFSAARDSSRTPGSSSM
jgi:hypothetical protein|tara:strand:+ start:518 stop:1108 length:591 start_codon:yes stop_codon:yes gene_type:complete